MSHLVTPFLLGSSRVQKGRIRQVHQTAARAFIALNCLADVTRACPSHSHNVVRKPGLGHSGGLRGRKTGLAGEERKPDESRGGQAEGQVPRTGPETRRVRLPDEEATERAKVLRLGRLQHGQGQDEEQAASCGGPRQEPGDRRPHSHTAGPAPQEVLFGDEQASRLASTNSESALDAPTFLPPSSSPMSPICLPHASPFSPPSSSPGTAGFNMSGRVA